MKNKLMSKTIRTATLLIAVVIFVTSFTVYINCGAVLGSKVETSLQVVSGDPSVLAGISFNIWSNGGNIVSNSIRNTVSFNETGKPKVTSYSQAYENAYLKDFELFSNSLYLTKDLKLKWSNKWPDEPNGNDTIQGFQIDNGLKYKMKYENYWPWSSRQKYLIDGSEYFTITVRDIDAIIERIYENRLREPTPWSFSLTSGIFRSDGQTIENILPIEIGSDDKDTKALNLEYIPQTKCLALAVAENINEVYVYIYHLETGAVEKHYISAYHYLNEETGEWDIPASAVSPNLFVNDNYLTVVDNLANGVAFTCIETDKTVGNVMRNRFRYESDFGYQERNFINKRKKQYNCFLSENEFFYAVSIGSEYSIYQDNVFDGYKLNIRVFKEGELVFDGYMIFPQGNPPTVITISDEIPFIIKDGLAVKRYVGTY